MGTFFRNNRPFGPSLDNVTIATDRIFRSNFGAMDRRRTGDVQLGNFSGNANQTLIQEKNSRFEEESSCMKIGYNS
jgi:hypothetical protein